MDADRMCVALGMEVVGSDLVPLGEVHRIVPPTVVVRHPWYGELNVPFAAIADINGNQLLVALPAHQVVGSSWPPPADSGPQRTS